MRLIPDKWKINAAPLSHGGRSISNYCLVSQLLEKKYPQQIIMRETFLQPLQSSSIRIFDGLLWDIQLSGYFSDLQIFKPAPAVYFLHSLWKLIYFDGNDRLQLFILQQVLSSKFKMLQIFCWQVHLNVSFRFWVNLFNDIIFESGKKIRRVERFLNLDGALVSPKTYKNFLFFLVYIIAVSKMMKGFFALFYTPEYCAR